MALWSQKRELCQLCHNCCQCRWYCWYILFECRYCWYILLECYAILCSSSDIKLYLFVGNQYFLPKKLQVKVSSDINFSRYILWHLPPPKKKLIITHYGMFGGILFQLCSRIDLKNSIRLQMRIWFPILYSITSFWNSKLANTNHITQPITNQDRIIKDFRHY